MTARELILERLAHTEIWKLTINGEFAVSNLGRIKRISSRFANTKHFVGKILKGGIGKTGYPKMTTSINGRFLNFNIHSLVAEAFIGPRPTGYQVNHKDGVKTNNRVENLEYVTPAQNSTHAMGLPGAPKGEKHGMAKLNSIEIEQIRHLLSLGIYNGIELAYIFGISTAQISRIKRGESWKKS